MGGRLLLAVVAVLVLDRLLGLTRFAVAPTTDLATFVGSPSVLLLADVLAATVVVACVALVRLVRRPRTRRGLIAVVLLAALVGLQLGATVVGSLTAAELPTDAYLARALLATGATLATLLVLSSLEEHRGSALVAAAARARAEALAVSGREAIARLRADVALRVREVLDDALASISAVDGQGGGTRLRALADDVIRPLSHRLAVAPAVLADVAPDVPTMRWRDTLRDVVRRPSVPVRSLAVTSGALALLRSLVTDQDAVRAVAPIGAPPQDGSSVAVSVDWVPLVASLAELVLVFALTWWGAARLASVLARYGGPSSRPSAVRLWTLTLLALVALSGLTVAAPAALSRLVDAQVAVSPVVSLLGTLLPLVAVTIGATTVRAVEDARGVLDADLARHTESAARNAARLQAVLGHEQQRLARTLHADVQSAVNAGGIALDRADRAGGVTPAIVEGVADRIAGAVERFLGGGGSDRPLCDRLEDVRLLWTGVCEVRLDVDAAMRDRVDDDPIARDLIVDLVAEACANAAVHGGASSVEVSVASSRAGEVALTVRDDGVRRAGGDRGGGGEGGLGSEVLRASCTRVRLTLGDDGATLEVGVPLG